MFDQKLKSYYLRPIASGVTLIFCYTILRFIFVFKNPIPTPVSIHSEALSMGSDWLSTSGIVSLFFEGLRFDLSAIAFANIFFLGVYLFIAPLLQHFFESYEIKLRKPFFMSYLTVHSFFIVSNIIDTFYFPFSGKRSTFDAFSLKQDISNQAGQLLIQFWPAPLLAITLTMFFIWSELYWQKYFLKRGNYKTSENQKNNHSRFNIYQRLLCTTLWVAVTILFARGGLGRKPLSVASAYERLPSELAPAVLNTTFSALKGLEAKPIPAFNYLTPDTFAQWKSNRDSAKQRQSAVPLFPKGTNVVFIILESFGMEYLGTKLNGANASLTSTPRPCYAPFLCELTKSSLFFHRGFANGRTSIESFYSIHAGIPALHEEPIVVSQFGANKLPGLPKRLAAEGYSTAFFHGGRNGTMFFDVMAKAVGFQNYYGYNEYPNSKADTDQTWGIYDQPFLQFTAKTITELKRPFMASVFTLSSHNPYKIPEHFKDHFPKGTLPIHESIGYSDMALQEFFETAKSQDWFHETLFVLTADHTSIGDDTSFDNLVGKHLVPILFYYPGGQGWGGPQISSQPAQHIDLAASVVDGLGLKSGAESFFGESIFNTQATRTVMNRNGAEFWFLRDEKVLKITESSLKTSSLGTYLRQGLPPSFTTENQDSLDQSSFIRDAQALIQAYFTGLIKNELAP